MKTLKKALLFIFVFIIINCEYLIGPTHEIKKSTDSSEFKINFYPPNGNFPKTGSVNLITNEEGIIYYTTNGSSPNCLSNTILPITFSSNTIIKAVLCIEDEIISEIYTTTYNIDGIYYINNIGSDTSGDGSIYNPYKTINKALLESENGNSIKIAEGNYNEFISISKNIDLYGGYNNTFTNRDITTNKTILNTATGSEGVIFIADSTTIIDGFHINGSTSTSNSFGIELASNALGIIRNNIVNGGSGSIKSIGIKLSNAPTYSIIYNNIILGGQAPLSIGLDLYFSTDVIANNTIFAGSGSTAIGIEIRNKSLPKLVNNIIFGIGNSGQGILENGTGANDGSPSLFQHNNVFGFATSLYYDDEGSGNLTTAADLNDYLKTTQNISNPSSGNVTVNMISNFASNISDFVNLKGSDGNINTWDSNDSQNWNLKNTVNCDIKQGGLDTTGLGWGYEYDYYFNNRTNVINCSVTNGGNGWSIGFMELD